ncbi:unnamed protein product, partial [Prunus brigantina]
MSSPNTRAKDSCSSRSPAYLPRDGIDNQATEAPTSLALFLLKWQNCSRVTLKLLYVFKVPLLWHPTWVNKNLSHYFPSSEGRNSPVKWSDWIDRLLPRYGAHWKRVGIYDAILLSKQPINRDENLLAAALCFWISTSNTFDFRLGPMTPTLLDMA